jgi:hypothetical protein
MYDKADQLQPLVANSGEGGGGNRVHRMQLPSSDDDGQQRRKVGMMQ